VPGNCELDLKALAKTTGDKKIETVSLKEVEPLTGYIRGGVTALACKSHTRSISMEPPSCSM
jgi:Cys-tRNA(Pro)/Cys-tRNA(Cys) deacylase